VAVASSSGVERAVARVAAKDDNKTVAEERETRRSARVSAGTVRQGRFARTVSAGNPGWRFMVEGMVGMMVSDFDNKGTKSDFAHLF
jgi:hypothetical protein